LKYLASLLILFSFGHVFAQDGYLPLDADKQIHYSDSGQPNLSKDELFKKTQDWVGKTFGNYQNAVTFEDPKAGILRITSYVPLIHARFAYARFDLTITVSDNKYDAHITTLDGVSPVHSPERISAKENETISSQEVLIKAENNRKKRAELEEELKLLKADNDGINTAMYNLLGSLKQFTN
jgi:hypothetical protein